MKATDWEFQNRDMVFGILLGCSFWLYSIDHQNVSASTANWAESVWHLNAEIVARGLFVLAALVLALADGFKAESWYWGFAVALGAYAATLKLWLFFVILALSLGLFWATASKVGKAEKAGD